MKIHIVSGFLGVGKTTFINKWLPLLDGQVCIIENEFGDISVDSQLIPRQIEVREIYAGCICCSLVGDFVQGIMDIHDSYKPDHLIIEPSGVGALSEVIRICQSLERKHEQSIQLGSIFTLVDVQAYEEYIESFGGFYTDQIKTAPMIFMSFTNRLSHQEMNNLYGDIRQINSEAIIITEDWKAMTPKVFETYLDLCPDYQKEENGPIVSLAADQFLSSYSVMRPRRLALEELKKILSEINETSHGHIVRAKGVLQLLDQQFIHFDYTPFYQDWSYIEPKTKVGIAFIGTQLNKQKLFKSFSKKISINNHIGGDINAVNRL